MTVSTSLDPWQFRLARGSATHPGDRQLGAYVLRAGPEIELVDLTDRHGRSLGVLFGFPIDLKEKKCLMGPHQLDLEWDSDTDAFAEKVLERFGGLFIWFCINDDVARIYLDSGGRVSCVYDPKAGVVGSTAHALLDEDAYQARFSAGLFDRLGVEREGWFPGGLTAHDGILRLLPNHCLDLTDWQARRHWPHGPLKPVDNPEDAVSEIITILQDQLEAMLGHPKTVAQALTAGHETRMLLAVARAHISDIDFVTVVGPDRHAIDSAMARRIAAAEGLRHLELPRRNATEEQRQLFIRRGGHCVVDSNSRYAPSVAPIARTHNFIGGLGGELARAFLWHDSDTPDLKLTPERLLRRYGLPDEQMLYAPLQNWLDAVPSENGLDVLDLAYIENRMGPWSAGQFYNDPTLVRYAPLFTRRATELMLGLPPDWKRAEKLSGEVVRQAWPELSRFPYNRVGLVQGLTTKALRVWEDPGIVRRKLRKMRG